MQPIKSKSKCSKINKHTQTNAVVDSKVKPSLGKVQYIQIRINVTQDVEGKQKQKAKS